MKENKDRRITFRLETKDINQLAEISKEKDVSMSEVVRDAVKEAIKNAKVHNT